MRTAKNHEQRDLREIVARLYFVDTPEAETAYRDRIDEQAAYWGITTQQAATNAHEATAFNRETTRRTILRLDALA